MKTTGSYPRLHIDTATIPAVGQAGGILLTETIRAAGLDRELSMALSRWAKPLATHDPGKIVWSNDQNLWMRPRENGTLEAYPPGQNPTEEVI
ncbi:MAG: hypothetical protein LKI24_04075 [Acidipropionibacterium sp.]|jgi:hypothetical protein|nr:hypothetical protein [Acidipropionibacterium sp.]